MATRSKAESVQLQATLQILVVIGHNMQAKKT